jgi:hypothetical protein
LKGVAVTIPSIETLARDWRLTWSAMRSGGLLLLADDDEDAAAAAVSALAGARYPPGDREQWRRTVASFNGALAAELRAFFRDAHLDPGVYEIPNYYAPQATNGRILRDSTSNGSNCIVVPKAPRIAVAFMAEHRALVRAANVSTWESLIAPIDPMAPYARVPGGGGDSFYDGMARALNDEFSREKTAYYDTLHGEMLFAVHAFLLHARL